MAFQDTILTDLDTLFSTSEFGVSATITPQVGTPISVSGLFDAPFEVVTAAGEVDMSRPHITVKTSAVSGLVRQNDFVKISGTEYRVKDIHPVEGMGWTTLILSLHRSSGS